MARIAFSWTANTEPDIAGYKLYAGRQSGVYTDPRSPTVFGLVTSGSYEIRHEQGEWYFALTAYDTEGLESGFSSELKLSIREPLTP